MWTWEALYRPERAVCRPEGHFVDLKGPSFGLINSCLGLKGPCVALRGPSYGLPSKWAPFRHKRAICRCGRACAALRGSSYGLRSKWAQGLTHGGGGTRARVPPPPIRTWGLTEAGVRRQAQKGSEMAMERLREPNSDLTGQFQSKKRALLGLKRAHVGLRGPNVDLGG